MLVGEEESAQQRTRKEIKCILLLDIQWDSE